MKLFCYSRTAIKELYDVRLANSLHLALFDEETETFTILNHNSGVLFGKASENADGSLNPKCLKDFILIEADADGFYKVACIPCDGDGNKDSESEGKAFLYSTKDFLEFSEPEVINIEEFEQIKTQTQKSETLPEAEGMFPGNMIPISDSVASRLQKKLLTPVNVGIKVEDNVSVASNEDVKKLTATALYSDGTTDIKKVRWDTTNVDFSTPGTYEIFGKVMQPHFEFPMAINRADPCVARMNGKYYYIATNDADGNHSLYIRQADTMEALKDAEEVLLLDSKTYDGIGGLLWAPEFHEINGKLYIFHACTPGEFFREESHVMELKSGGDPMNRGDWSRPKRVVRADGTNICEAEKRNHSGYDNL